MTLLLGFSPFFLFALLSRLSTDLALWLAFAAAFVVTIRDFVESPQLRLLDGTSLILFGLLALGRGFVMPDLSLAAVRMVVEAGLFAVTAWSLLRRRPFSMAYAGGETGGRSWPHRAFLRVNYAISAIWVLALAAMALADGVVIFLPAPLYIGIAVSVAAVGVAATWTLRYPVWAAARLAESSSDSPTR